MIGTDPQTALVVLLDGGYAVISESTLEVPKFHLTGLGVVTLQSVVGTDIKDTAKLTGDTCGGTIVQTVFAKCR